MNITFSGSNLQALDRDHLTPLDHIMKDRFSKIRFTPEKNSEVYMWGTNSNYTLGMQQTKPYPELLSKQNIDVPIKQVSFPDCVKLDTRFDIFLIVF